MFLSYRNQSIDLRYKSDDWFLNYGKVGPKRLKSLTDNLSSDCKVYN